MASLFRHNPRVLLPSSRSFSTTIPKAISLQWEKNDPEALADAIPPYPYPTRWYKQSRLGLYGGQRIQFGNNVGKKIAVKTRRSWHPNVVNKKLYSRALQRRVQVRVTVRVLRTIEKCGGLDEYLLGEKESRIRTLGESGWWLRWALTKTEIVQKRFAKERELLGLSKLSISEIAIQSEEAAIEEEDIDSHSLLEEASEEEAQLAMTEGESVTSDDAFAIETGPDLPVLKFRVGPGSHVVLTPKGWKRTRPSPLRWILKDKEKIAQYQLDLEGTVKQRVEDAIKVFADELDRKIEAHNEAVAPVAFDWNKAKEMLDRKIADATGTFETRWAEKLEAYKKDFPEEEVPEDTMQKKLATELAQERLAGNVLTPTADEILSLEKEVASTMKLAHDQAKLAQKSALEALTLDPRETALAARLQKDVSESPTITLSPSEKQALLVQTRKTLERRFRREAKLDVDRIYEERRVEKDVKVERRRLEKYPSVKLSRNVTREKAELRRSVLEDLAERVKERQEGKGRKEGRERMVFTHRGWA